jgi:transposase
VEADFECFSERRRVRWTAPFLENRKFVEGVIWIGKTAEDGAVCLKNMANRGSVHKHFKRWSDKMVWQMIFNT